MKSDVDYLLSTRAIRDQARAVFELCRKGSTGFAYRPERLDAVVSLVLEVTRANYPGLEIPFHSRWGHFRAGGVDRAAELRARLVKGGASGPRERARVELDLVIPSVLLDAGAGDEWKYHEASSGQTFARSEGLGVASFHLFLSGALSADGRSLRTDAEGLARVDELEIERAFQGGHSNPLIGVAGRAGLLRSLAGAVRNEAIFPGKRPGGILDSLERKHGQRIPATGILRAVLDGLGPIWPGRIEVEGRNLGDVWRHSQLGLVPFHKLSQWMTYSLIEPIRDAGFTVEGVEELTGLAEYRNGGLLLDSGLLELREPAAASREWSPDSDLIIEWRALTVHLLDEIAERVRKALGRPPREFPLAMVLEGGTWWAGRKLARERRAGGGPPLRLKSDGTVF